MSYNRQPQTVLAGTALVQNPPPSALAPAGIIPVTLDCEIATANSLGVIRVGSGLSITPQGVLSSTGSVSNIYAVHLTAVDYTVLDSDYYIGATINNITITLPTGTLGKVYVVKNQHTGNITVTGTSGQQINTAATKVLGAQDAVMVIFDGTSWNII